VLPHATMKKTLGQHEIDALFSKARESQKADTGAERKKAVPCDLRRANQPTPDHVSAITTLHETFARRLSSSLAAYFRVTFEVNLMSVEQLTYWDFLSRMPELTYFASMHALPIDARAAIQLDMSLAFPIVDVILGGSGQETIETRDLTEIEEQILETVFRLIVQDLQTTWSSTMPIEFQFEQRQRNVQMQSTMQPGERILCLTFEARVSDVVGTLAMVFPAVVASALLRRLSAQWSYSERTPSLDSRRRLRELILESRFLADLSLPGSSITIRQLVNLEVGHVLSLPKRAREPVHLNIAGEPMFRAHPVQHGTQRAAKIQERETILNVNSRKPGA